MELKKVILRGVIFNHFFILFRDNQDSINHMHFSTDGASLISSSEDDQIVIYDCERGTQKRTLNSKKYGVDLIHFTQNKTNVVHASTKENDIIRYLNVHENKYISYFRGHTKKVVTLCMNPTDETFLSGSLDKTIRLWDIRYLNLEFRVPCFSNFCFFFPTDRRIVKDL